MIKYSYVNGQLTPVAEASLKVNDLAILRGYGIFDFFLVRRRQPMFMEDYLNRFFRSAEMLHLRMPVSRGALREQIYELIAANGVEDSGMRLVLTGGYADDGYTPTAPNLLILQHPLAKGPSEQFDSGVKLMSYEYQRELPEVKTINYLMGIRLLPELKAAGAFEPLYYSQGCLRESVRSNFFLVLDDQRIATPGSNILFGVTRKKVIELARNYFDVEERDVRLEELYTAREAFLTGSNKLVMPVVAVDDHLIGSGRPGPVTRRLMDLFEAFTMEYLTTSVG